MSSKKNNILFLIIGIVIMIVCSISLLINNASIEPPINKSFVLKLSLCVVISFIFIVLLSLIFHYKSGVVTVSLTLILLGLFSVIVTSGIITIFKIKFNMNIICILLAILIYSIGLSINVLKDNVKQSVFNSIIVIISIVIALIFAVTNGTSTLVSPLIVGIVGIFVSVFGLLVIGVPIKYVFSNDK